MASGQFEIEETKLIRHLLADVDVFVNIGANIGYYCLHALSLNKRVIAIEPLQSNVYYLVRNIIENGFEASVEVFPVAIGAETNLLEIWGAGTGASLTRGWAGNDELQVERVPVMTLDRLLGDELKDKKALILADVEGSEYQMLLGSTRTLKLDPRPIWMIEIVTSEHQPFGSGINCYLKPTFEIFFDNGYKALSINEHETSVTREDVDRVYAGEKEFGCHNFLFY